LQQAKPCFLVGFGLCLNYHAMVITATAIFSQVTQHLQLAIF
jgi:hypothetical protein